jgi:cytochrome P450
MTLTAERVTASRLPGTPAARLSSWTMTCEALTIGFDAGDGFLGRARGNDIVRFRCAGRRFVTISHPDYVDHVLHEARLKYVKSNEYEPIRASAGINLLTDEGDSWAAHRGQLNPTFARRHLNAIVDLMIDPIPDVADALETGARFGMHQTMVQATLRVVANSLFSQDFGPLIESMSDLATRGLRHAERLERLGLWGLMPRPVWRAVDDDVIGTHHIRRGTTVVIPIHHIHHDPRWWPDPETFDPNRFFPPSKDRPRSAYLPFGSGRRICIGQSFALMEMVLMAAIMAQRFTFDLVPDDPVELEATLTLRPKHGVHVIGSRRE